MTIATQSSRQDYRGNNCTKSFAYTFKITADADLDVYVDGTQKTLTSEYTVSGAGVATGGTVTFVTAPGCNLAVAIVRDVPYTQSTDYVENDPFPAQTHEDAIDKLTMLVQQVIGIATRSWRFAAGSPKAAAGYELDEPIGGRYPRIKSDCTGVEFVALENCGTYANPVTTKGDTIVGNDAGTQERLARGAAGTTLRMHAHSLKPHWTVGDVLLTNKSDAQADAGRVFAIDMDCNSAFSVHTSQGCLRVNVVTPDAVGDDCQGMTLFAGGPVTMLAQGAIARGEYVKQGSTIGAVQTTCVSHTDHRPIPRGTVGLALGHSSGGCVSLLKFPVPSHGMQGLMTVRRNRSASVSGTPCTQVDLVADGLVLVDSCNDLVVVRTPASLTNNICTSWTNKKNGRDGSEAGGGIQIGDIHFWWVYEGASGTLYSRASAKGPETSGPDLQSCETNFAYSHSLYWDGNCLRKHTVRGHSVSFDCTDSTRVLNAGAATCETRIGLATIVPAVATRIRLRVFFSFTSATAGAQVYLGHRLNCLAFVLDGSQTTDTTAYATEVEVPNVNQEIYYRLTAGAVTITVQGFDVPSGDS